MKTQIFETHEDFLARPDKLVNGVDRDVARQDPGLDVESGNTGCWNCVRCTDCEACVDCYDCVDCVDLNSCNGCMDCSGCAGCTDCEDCHVCSACLSCANSVGCCHCTYVNEARTIFGQHMEQRTDITIPVVENIHTKVLEAVTSGRLEMNDWHTCSTTHCRGGWAVELAGDAGYLLEGKTSAEFAAMAIYAASSPHRVSPARFAESNEEAMADIKRCAALETAN